MDIVYFEDFKHAVAAVGGVPLADDLTEFLYGADGLDMDGNPAQGIHISLIRPSFHAFYASRGREGHMRTYALMRFLVEAP